MIDTFAPITCPLCQAGLFIPFSDGIHEFKHSRKIHTIGGLHYAVCNACGTRGYLEKQRAINNRIIKDYQNDLADYISPSDILSVREKYSLSQEAANRIFGGGSQGFSKWERGAAVPAGPTARLLKLALESSDSFERLARIANVKLPAAGEIGEASPKKKAEPRIARGPTKEKVEN